MCARAYVQMREGGPEGERGGEGEGRERGRSLHLSISGETRGMTDPVGCGTDGGHARTKQIVDDVYLCQLSGLRDSVHQPSHLWCASSVGCTSVLSLSNDPLEMTH
jgi:hypothetical protein